MPIAPIAPIESMALGVPVVAPAIDGLSEVVAHGESGLLLRSPSIDDYADAVESLIADPARLAEMSGSCVARARGSFDRSVSSSRYATLYDGLLQAVPARRAGIAGNVA